MQKKIDAQTLHAIHLFITKLRDHYNFSNVILFGSRARQTHKVDSDADVAVLLKGAPGKFVVIKLFMDDLAYEVLLDTGIRIQPLPIWEEQWHHPEQCVNPRLLKNIHREGIFI